MVEKTHTLVALVADKPGVLNRVSSLFRRRAFNIQSITVGHSETPNISRMTIVVDGTNTSVEQVRKQLDKEVNVTRVIDVSGEETVTRELALIKVKATATTRSEIIEIVSIFRATIVDVAADSLIVEATGDADKIESLLNLLRSYGVRELARTGRLAMTRGEKGPLATNGAPADRKK
jgi:acetolactate synthase-1/3 small subunit